MADPPHGSPAASSAGRDAGDQLRWLKRHRLIAAADLLAGRALIRAEVSALANRLNGHRPAISEATLAEEKRVISGLASAGLPVLALKGLRLAWTVYPHPAQRPRSDMDLLAAPENVAAARELLDQLGYRPLHAVAGGTPMEQEAWVADLAGGRSMIDLHWKLRNHPCLRDRLDFDEQWAAAVALPGLGEHARGQSNVHALLNASMHWFDRLYAERFPLLWLLDKDLLWRAMSETEQQQACTLAAERGLAGLLGESMRLTRKHFATPISNEQLAALDEAGRKRRPSCLIALHQRRLAALRFALSCEPDLRSKLRRVRHSLFPPPAHMRQRFPHGSRLGLAGLYWQRIRKRL